MVNRQAILRSLSAIEDEVARIRAELGSDLPEEVPVGPNGKVTTTFDVLRGLRFLEFFYRAEGGQLHPEEVSDAARAAGYDPRGTSGYYGGNATLESQGDVRVLTQVGRDWFETTYPRFKEQLLERYPDAEPLDLG